MMPDTTLPSPLPAERDGFTLVEVIVAIMIMTVGILGLAASAATVNRMVGGGAQQTIAANLAQSRFERLRSTGCNLASGTATTRSIAEKWTVSTVAGSTREFNVVDSVSFSNGRSTRRQVYTSVVRC